MGKDIRDCGKSRHSGLVGADSVAFYCESPVTQTRMSHACMSEFMDMGRASEYEQVER